MVKHFKTIRLYSHIHEIFFESKILIQVILFITSPGVSQLVLYIENLRYVRFEGLHFVRF